MVYYVETIKGREFEDNRMMDVPISYAITISVLHLWKFLFESDALHLHDDCQQWSSPCSITPPSQYPAQ
ncbi:hypothetical protein RchiOBHm_Chr3g0454871 [Rosa chinensis]|uniref:Uncharacterized protein n=1 Tax=Rosa chinensis TaxID=74649 RepID=A0A2P6R6W4_ROSCH|nr:hypothetical protein RchiOBHm_Chr3g0454871 [Rosa chinensis]